MRILHIRFKNLNSLAGEWSIDLTHPAFTSDGIFAITGPTGAGKSTILDAICLALYGSTPRLGRITKAGNEIMSRHTGECFAQLQFETQTGRYESTWSQHRARKKVDGELQHPQHQLIDLKLKKTIAEKKSDVSKEIESVTGLDFERFTRSILLAQGSFAAFLNASADERAPILEQITGTAIYSEISIKAHERCVLEQKKLHELKQNLKQLRAMSAEEEQALTSDLAQHQQRITELDAQVQTTAQALHWRTQLNTWEQELTELHTQHTQTQSRQTAFQPQLQRLEQARKALELASDYTHLSLLRANAAECQTQLAQIAQQLPTQIQATQHISTQLQHAQTELTQTKQAWQRLRPLLAQVRTLDTELKTQATQISTTTEQLQQQHTEFKALQTQTLTTKNTLEQQQTQAQALTQFLEQQQADAALVEQLAGLQQQFKHVQALDTQLNTQHSQQTAAHTQLNQAQEAVTQHTERLTAHTNTLNHTQNTASQLKHTLKTLLNKRELKAWRTELNTLTTHHTQLTQLGELIHTVTDASTQYTQDEARHQTHAAELLVLAQRLAEQHTKTNQLEQHVQSLEDKQVLLERIKSLEEQRTHLHHGQPCPLCGALEHPYARGHIPTLDENTRTLHTAKQDFKTQTEALHALKEQQSLTQKDLHHLTEHLQQQRYVITRQTRSIEEQFNELGLQVAHSEWADALATLKTATKQEITQITALIEQAETLEADYQHTQTQLQQQQTEHFALTQALTTSQFAQQEAEQQCQRLEQETAALNTQLQAALQHLEGILQPLGVELLEVTQLPAIEQTLVTRRTQWLEQLKRHNACTQSMTQLEQELKHLTTQLSQHKAHYDHTQTQLNTLKATHHTTHTQRIALFQTKQPDEEEQHQTLALEHSEQDVQTQQQVLTQAQAQLTRSQTEHTQLQTRLATLHTQLATQEHTFTQHLQHTGFASETAYQAACLPEMERERLALQAQALMSELAMLATKLQEQELKLAREQAKQLSEQSVPQLLEQQSALEQQKTQLQHTIGDLQAQLTRNHELKAQHQYEQLAIQSQEREYERWKNLDALIGSADGKKYRNFAQGLTFDIMIQHANQQLQKMTERYLLKRDTKGALDLSVMDTYQAGEVRSTRNLSGGESFLVSLALALGLSKMASQNVRVDSLFLDEGFGTLDQEALETALETLSNLQQEGKLIGIISHVQALQERISTQIRIQPQTGGRSVIRGLGCTSTV